MKSNFLSSTSESRSKVFTAADSSSDENLEEDDEADEPKMPLDWKSRTVAVSGEKHTNILIKFNSTYIIL